MKSDTTIRRGRGRPPALAAGSRTKSIGLRYSDAERDAWDRAAVRAAAKTGRPIALIEWIRAACNEAAK